MEVTADRLLEKHFLYQSVNFSTFSPLASLSGIIVCAAVAKTGSLSVFLQGLSAVKRQ